MAEFVVRTACVATATLLLMGCAGGTGTAPEPPAAQLAAPVTATAAPGNVAFAVGITPPVKPGQRLPKYVSPSTQSLEILVDATEPVIIDTTPSSPDCAPNPQQPGSYVCTARPNVATGNHVFTVTAYDSTGAQGNVLSVNSTGPVYVKPSGTTMVSLVLQGVVTYVVMTLTSTYPAIGTPAVIGLLPLVQDADLNLIVGPAPFQHPVTLTSSDTVNGPLSKTQLNSPADEAGITANYDGAPVRSITYSAASAGVPPGNVTNFIFASYPVTTDQFLYAANSASNTCYGGGNVSVFDVTNPGVAPSLLSCAGLISPLGVAVDTLGRLYVSNNAFATRPRPPVIDVFDTLHGETALPPITGGGMNFPAALAVADGILYVADFGTNVVDVFDTLHGNAPLPPITGGGLDGPFGLTLDSDGKLYVGNILPYTGGITGGSISVFDTLHGNAVLPAITNSALDGPWGLTIDGAGRLYVTNENGASVVPVFDTVHGNAPLPAITGNGLLAPEGIALDSRGRLYVGNSNATVSVFDTQHANAPLSVMTGGGLNGPMEMTVH